MYGAGDWKLGYTKTGVKAPRRKIAQIGAEDRKRFLEGLPAMGKLVKAITRTIDGYMASGVRVKGRDYLIGLDGRRVFVRSSHAALNTLLQSAGALIMKRALVIADADLQAAGLVPGVDYEYVANIHDEHQLDVAPAHVEFVKATLAHAITKAGEYYSFRCPLIGNSDHGRNWKETH